jgi:hypothetical protein
MFARSIDFIVRVLRSDLYRDIWKFIFIGGAAGGLLVTLSGLILWGLSFQENSPLWAIGIQGDTPLIALFMGLYGFAMGLIAGVLGFPIMYLAGRWTTRSQFSKVAVLIGIGIALGASYSLIQGSFFERLSYSCAIFPGLPILGGVYCFRYFSLKIIFPYSPKK